MVSGIDASGSKTFSVVSEDELPASQKAFQQVNSTKIYSIQKADSTNIKIALATNDSDQTLEMLLNNHVSSSEYLHNKFGKICLVNLEVKAAGERVVNAQVASVSESGKSSSTSSSSSGVKKESAEDHISRVFANKAPPAVLKSKSGIQASSFFNKPAAPANSTSKAEAPASKQTKAVSDKAAADKAVVVAETTAVAADSQPTSKPAATDKSVMGDDDEDEEWDSGYKVDKNRLKKRNISEGTVQVGEVEDEEPVQVDEEDQSTVKKQKTAKAAQQHVSVHGAMDDYMEDVAIAEFKQQRAEDESGAAPAKRTKKKLVEKVSTHLPGPRTLCPS